MAQWGAFAVLTGLLLAVLLVLARTSQDLIRDELVGGDDEGGTDSLDLRDPVPDSVSEEIAQSSAPKPSPAAGEDSQASKSTDLQQPEELSPTVGSPPESPTPSPRPAEQDGDPSRAGPSVSRESSEPSVELTTAALLANVVFTQGLFGAILLAGAWYFDVPAWAFGVTAAPGSTGLPALALGVGFGLVLWVGSETSASFADAVGATYDERLRGMLAPESVGGWIVLLVLVLPVIAGVEELLFRAAAIGAIHAGFGVSPWFLAVVSSVVFGFAHGAQGRVGIAVTGLLGFALATGYVLTGSLLVVVVAHYVVNATEFVVHEGLDLGRLWE